MAKKRKTKINAVAKGRRNQRKTSKYLEEAGWQVYTVIRPSFVAKGANHDIFGVFDHVALKGRRLRFVQTKSNRCSKKVRDEIANLQMPAGTVKEVFIWIDYQKEPEIIQL